MTGAYYLARALVERGHEVRFFASSFNYYKRRELRLRGTQLRKDEDHEGLHFTWVRTTPHGSSMLWRLVNMLSFMMTALWAGLWRRERPDVVVGTCPHLFAVTAARLVARFRGAKFAYEVRDLWPQTFVDSGVLSDRSWITRLLRGLERHLYRDADSIISVLPFVNEYLERTHIDTRKWTWIPNGIDTGGFPRLPPPARNADGKMTFMYLGGHARYQGLETLLHAADLLQQRSCDAARFVLVGDGVVKPELLQLADALGLKNVEFRDAVPRRDVPGQLAEATVCIFHILPLPVLRYGVSPNKLCDYMLSGRPVLCAGELRNNPVAEAGAGICIESQDPVAMADAVERLLSIGEPQLDATGQRGRSYAFRNWDCRLLAERFEDALGRSTTDGDRLPVRRGVAA